MDPFVIYEDIYKSLREAINGAMYGNQMEELDKATQVHRVTILLLTFSYS